MNIETKGLILRDLPLKESDKFITVLTPDLGRISVYCNGARRIKSLYLTSTMPLCYDEFVLYKKGDKFWLREAAVIESFAPLREDIEKNALANYFADVLCDVTVENDLESCEELLRLALNSLYAAAVDTFDERIVKAAFEFRLVSFCGFMPNLVGCSVCDNKKNDYFLDTSGGVLVCEECRKKEEMNFIDTELIHLTPSAKQAIEYVIGCDIRKLFSFKLEERDVVSFSLAAERYLTAQLERSFETLKYYHDIKRV